MYHMRNIVSSTEQIILPNCMYPVKNSITLGGNCEMDINIRDQVIKFLKETPNKQIKELEARQDKLLLKLDLLYDKIKNISTICNLSEPTIELKSENQSFEKSDTSNLPSQEVVLTLNPDNLPWFLNIFLKKSGDINVTWHIHSSIDKGKLPKILAFFKTFQELYPNRQDSKSHIRLIFKNGVSVPELKLSSLDIPIIGTSNVLRYLCYIFNNVLLYNFNDHKVDSLLDLCHLLERSSVKNKDILNTVFANKKMWIYEDKFTIVDVAFYSVIKPLQSFTKCVPKQWLDKCEKNIL